MTGRPTDEGREPGREVRPSRLGQRFSRLPGPDIHPVRRTLRYLLARLVATVVVRTYVRLSFEGSDRLPKDACILCFNHLNWADPFMLMACLPWRPRLYFFGPKEEDMARGGRNRLMQWVGTSLPYKPAKNDLLEATRRVESVLSIGGVVAIAGEGRIHVGEGIVLPLSDGPAYFAFRGRVPLVPVAVNGTSWLAFRRRVRVAVGEPLVLAGGRPTREAVDDLTRRAQAELEALVGRYPDQPPPGPFGRWLTELFNEWPGGTRPERERPASAQGATRDQNARSI